MADQGRSAPASGTDELDLPSRGWFALDLRQMLDDLEGGGREAALARLSPAPPAGTGPKAPEEGSTAPALPPSRPGALRRRVPDRDIVTVEVRPGEPCPVAEIVPYPGRSRSRLPVRTLLLAALLGLGLLGLTVQRAQHRPAIVVPVSLDQRVIVT